MKGLPRFVGVQFFHFCLTITPKTAERKGCGSLKFNRSHAVECSKNIRKSQQSPVKKLHLFCSIKLNNL